MAKTEIAFEETKGVRADMTISVAAGEQDATLIFAEPVPPGKVLLLNISVTGRYIDAKDAPADRVDSGSVTK